MSTQLADERPVCRWIDSCRSIDHLWGGNKREDVRKARERDLRLTYLRRGAWGEGGTTNKAFQSIVAARERDVEPLLSIVMPLTARHSKIESAIWD